MFEALKKKLASWIGTSKKEKKKEKSKKNPKVNKKKGKEKKIPEKNIIEKIEVEEIIEKEEIKEQEITEEPKKEGFFSKLFKKFSSAKITKEIFNEIFQELEIILLENNVALEVVEKIRENLSKSLIGTEIKRAEIDNIRTKELQEKGFRVIRLKEHDIGKMNLNMFNEVLNNG